MIEEILPGIHRATIPLPKTPLGNLNCYVLRDRDRCLILDTGFNTAECSRSLFHALRHLGVDPAESDVLLTHMHSDHSGLGYLLEEHGASVHCHPLDGETINAMGEWEEILSFGYRCGLPEARLRQARDSHPGYRYRPTRPVRYVALQDGDTIHAGTYRFTCLHTPGHTDGHLCLHEPDRGLLFCGDLILRGITPNIAQWSETGNPLRDYLDSLERIRGLGPFLALPGHREPFRDPGERIEEIEAHHRGRLEEILSLLPEEGATPFEVASKMHWDLDCKDWRDFPLAQKWFATGEAMAHLRYLEQQGRIACDLLAGRYVFSNPQSGGHHV
jgi:glyoxylase-like metal-dependent hydrolase (beta-lactamase superfamily II)